MHQAGLFILLVLVFFNIDSGAQPALKGSEVLSGSPKYYKAVKINQTIIIDGNLDENAWQKTSWSDEFVDITGNIQKAPALKTHFKILWDNAHLYVAAQLEEPHIWGSLQQKDTILFHDNVFEIFIDPDGDTRHYIEIEINALRTIFDLQLDKPYRDGGKADINWDLKGLEVGVHHYGTLNYGNDKDTGWTIEVKIPIASLPLNGNSSALTFDQPWRVNFCRAQWPIEFTNGKYKKQKDDDNKVLPKSNWVWSPQGVNTMHYPECWGYVYFVSDTMENITLEKPLNIVIKERLWLTYYKQKDSFQQYGRYNTKLTAYNFLSYAYTENMPLYMKLKGEKPFYFILEAKGIKEEWRINNLELITTKPLK